MDAGMINKIQKSKEIAEQPERITFNTLSIEFRGDNNTYQIDLAPDGWSCTCPGFGKYGICPHIMAIEKIYQPMLKRNPLPYAPGQNIVSDVKKAKRYSAELERMRFLQFEATVQGDNKDHTVTYDHGKWNSTSSYFHTHGIGAFTMALERVLSGLVDPVKPAVESVE